MRNTGSVVATEFSREQSPTFARPERGGYNLDNQFGVMVVSRHPFRALFSPGRIIMIIAIQVVVSVVVATFLLAIQGWKNIHISSVHTHCLEQFVPLSSCGRKSQTQNCL
jgi:hypothetical protein